MLLIFGWSGATPARTSPHGVGSLSRTSTNTSPLPARRPSTANIPAGPAPMTATDSVNANCLTVRAKTWQNVLPEPPDLVGTAVEVGGRELADPHGGQLFEAPGDLLLTADHRAVIDHRPRTLVALDLVVEVIAIVVAAQVQGGQPLQWTRQCLDPGRLGDIPDVDGDQLGLPRTRPVGLLELGGLADRHRAVDDHPDTGRITSVLDRTPAYVVDGPRAGFRVDADLDHHTVREGAGQLEVLRSRARHQDRNAARLPPLRLQGQTTGLDGFALEQPPDQGNGLRQVT